MIAASLGRAGVACWLVVAPMLGCGGGSDDEAIVRGEVLVSAASSLGGAFAQLEHDFEAERPGLDVVLNLAGSSTLREQILAGAPADVFASADVANVERVAAAGHVDGAPRIFARNSLQLAVPADDPGAVTGIHDLAREELLVGLCAEEVPCGALAARALAAAGVEPSVDTREPSVRALLTRIEAGELDVGLVYRSDVLSSTGVRGIDIPGAQDVVSEYTIVRLAGSPNRAGATAFVDFVLSDAGQAILGRFGFAPANAEP